MLLSDRYEVGPRLGAGGEAEVFRARDLKTGADVAVRILHRPPGIPTHPTEPAVWHPAWVRRLDRGADPVQGAYAVFELIEGETLAERVARGPLSIDEWRVLAAELVDALAVLHEAGWVHGDLNASNLVRETDPARWRLLELPFHAESFAAPGLGHAETVAPEQINGQAPDARSDAYALGCLLYFAAAGRYPFSGDSTRDILIDKLLRDPAPLDTIAPDFPPDEAARIMALLERKAAARSLESIRAGLH
jgi:serine/threonine protein kinase